jgi:hypothetical protein
MDQQLKIFKAGMVVHTCDLSIWEAEAGGSQAQDQPGLHSEILSQNNTKNFETKQNKKPIWLICW